MKYLEGSAGGASFGVAARLRLKLWAAAIWMVRLELLAALCVLLALVVYVFFLSAGTWTHWSVPKRYYDDLGVALRAGRLDLDIQPPAGLLALSDPYDPAARTAPDVQTFVTNVWDLSFHGGKFYPYWGPAPGLILALVKLVYQTHIADEYLVFGFLAGLLVFTTLLILKLRRAYAADVPVALVLAGILMAAFVLPVPWMMNRARVYEAAIGAGQFFLIGGLFFAYNALDRREPSAIRLAVAAIFWVFAVGSRLTTLLPVAVLTVTTFTWVAKTELEQGPLRRVVRFAAALGLPLLLGLIGLGWYNWARFGSPLDMGIRYMLSDTNMNQLYAQTFSLKYALPNSLLYLINPIALRARFPFLVPTVMQLPAFVDLTGLRMYHVQNSAGLLFVAPFALFAILPVAREISRVSAVLRGKTSPHHDQASWILSWFTWSLVGMVLLSLGALLAYFYVAVRYLVELTPALLLLSMLGIWDVYRHLPPHRGARWPYVLLVVLLALITVAVGVLLAFSEDNGTLLRFNPQLMKQLVHFFGK